MNILAGKSDSGMSLIIYSCFLSLNMNMDLKIDLSEANHLKDHIFALNTKGETDIEKVGIISASLLILGNLSNHVNARSNFLEYISAIVNKLIAYDYNFPNSEILICLAISFIKTFAVDMTSFHNVEQRESNFKGILGFLFKNLNNIEIKHNVN